jgi:hypothetical protein
MYAVCVCFIKLFRILPTLCALTKTYCNLQNCTFRLLAKKGVDINWCTVLGIHDVTKFEISCLCTLMHKHVVCKGNSKITFLTVSGCGDFKCCCKGLKILCLIGKVGKLLARWPRNHCFLAGTRYFCCFSPACRLALGPIQAPLQWMLVALFLGIVKLILLPSAEVKNVWNFTSTLPCLLHVELDCLQGQI